MNQQSISRTAHLPLKIVSNRKEHFQSILQKNENENLSKR